MSKALIEKAFEKWKNDSGCRNNSCNDCQGGCNGAFIAGATWQREQLEAEIKEAKDILNKCLVVTKEALRTCQDFPNKCDRCPVTNDCHWKRKALFIKECEQFIAKLDLLEGEK